MIDAFNVIKKMSEQMDELSKSMIINPFSDDFFEVFTKKRMELMKDIIDNEPNSIRELASSVERDIKNVFEDLKLLHGFNLIEFEKEGKLKIIKQIAFNKKILISSVICCLLAVK